MIESRRLNARNARVIARSSKNQSCFQKDSPVVFMQMMVGKQIGSIISKSKLEMLEMTDIYKCPECSATHEPGAKKCEYCGSIFIQPEIERELQSLVERASWITNFKRSFKEMKKLFEEQHHEQDKVPTSILGKPGKTIIAQN